MYNYPQPGYPQFGYPPPARKRPVWPWVLGGIAVLFVILIALVIAFVLLDRKPFHQIKITYSVEGTVDSADIIYTGSDNRDSSDQHVALPWTRDVLVGSKVVFVSLSATALERQGTLRCRITADGKEVSTQGPSQMIAACIGSTGNKWTEMGEH